MESELNSGDVNFWWKKNTRRRWRTSYICCST